MAVTALGELIEDQKARLGISYRDMERRVGGKIKAKRFQQYGTDPIANVPPTETLQAIAKALQLPVSVVVDAALESVGLRRTTIPNSEWVTISHRAEEMTEAKQRALKKQVEAYMELLEEES